MSENLGGWEKNEQFVSSETAEQDENHPVSSELAGYYKIVDPGTLRRFNKKGKRRGHLKWAAPLGFVVLILALVGLIFLVRDFANRLSNTDDTSLYTELESFLYPVTLNNPTPFDNIEFSKQDELLMAAIWKITDEDLEFQRKNKTNSKYAVDSFGRLCIPIEEVTSAFKTLFGSGSSVKHKSIGDVNPQFQAEYSPENGVYYVPLMSANADYLAKIGAMRQQSGLLYVEIGFVPKEKVSFSPEGEKQIRESDAEYTHIYILEENASGGWFLKSITEKASILKNV